ncbi:MAG: permease [Erysipelotrichaceae bacterium]|nr:permease [Erysipelotrichaceae bacterium]
MLAWFNDQFLKMQWLYDGVEWLVVNVFGLSLNDRIGASIHFFIYDVIKIYILLVVIVYGISYIQSYYPPERTREALKNVKGLFGNFLGALFGTLTPFCSCSSIPLFIGFTNAGLPLGVTFSFLICSPLVDIASVLLISSFFGVRIATIYVLTGMTLAIVGGWVIGSLKMEKHVEPFVYNNVMVQLDEQKLTRKERHQFSVEQALDIFKKTWVYVIVGVAIGAGIHNWIPEQWILLVLGQDKWYSVLLATAVGIPMYASLFGTLPIAIALVAKGVGIGTVLAFMMSVTALSLPSIIMLKNVVKTKLLILFVTYVSLGILLIGYVFNIFL